MNECANSRNSFSLVWDVWENHAQKNPKGEAIIHWDALGGSFRWTYGNLWESALKISNQLIKDGVARGDVCALMIRHNKYFYPIYMGISAIGAIPAVIAYPNARLHPEKFLSGLSGMAQKSGLDYILTERELETIIKPIITSRQTSLKGIFYPLEGIEDLKYRKPDSILVKKNQVGIKETMPFLLQHSSGTTGLQKAVVLSHSAILEHVKVYSKAIKLSRKDKVISWLPLYHDMGLIAAFHMPLIRGIPSVQIDPFQWVSAPSVLFHAISQEKATLTWLPNFAYKFMADRIPEREIKNIDLSSMRMFISAGEVVRSESLKKFFDRFHKYGVKRKSLAVLYGMAEATFAVTQTKPDSEAVTLTVDRDALAKKIVKPPRDGVSKIICVSSGRPISGCSLRIIDEHFLPLPEDRVGAVLVKSAFLFDGYRNDPDKTKEAFKGGWYVTGDLGFCHKKEYYIVGRADDVITVAGVNIFPEDIEAAVNNVKGIVPGRVVAFGVDNQQSGTQDICVVAEAALENESEKDSLKLAVMQAGMSIDVTISRVYLVVPRWLIKSSSGKPSRKTNRARILSGKW